MREIKFRGFDPITKKFIYGNLLFTNETYYIIPFLTNGCMSQKEMMLRWVSPCYQVIPETVGQFTGLHDKNGVDIYENDKIFDGKYNGIIEYRECSFIVNWEIHCQHDEDLNYWNDKILVIGNIHERSKQDEEVK